MAGVSREHPFVMLAGLVQAARPMMRKSVVIDQVESGWRLLGAHFCHPLGRRSRRVLSGRAQAAAAPGWPAGPA